MTPQRSYLICTSPRSGSSLLGDALAITSVAGSPMEWFGPAPLHEPESQSTPEVRELRQLFETAGCETRFLSRILSLGTTSNGVFGSKLHLQQIGEAKRILREHLGDRHSRLDALLQAVFPNLRFIWLVRRDKVSQAISWYRAQHTGVFHRFEPADADRPPMEPKFDARAIYRHVDNFSAQEIVWAQIFEKCELKPMVVYYEDLIQHYERTIKEIVQFVGVSTAGLQVPTPRMQKQADGLTAQWKALFEQQYPEVQVDAHEDLMPWIDALLTD